MEIRTEELLSLAQAAREIGITRGGISYAVSHNLLPAQWHGPFQLVTRGDVEEYKKNRPYAGRRRKNPSN